MSTAEHIDAARELRGDITAILWRMRAQKARLIEAPPCDFVDKGETVANHIISIRNLEDALSRQNMVISFIGHPDPLAELPTTP